MDKQLFQQEQRHLYLLVVGPILDSNYAKEVYYVISNDELYRSLVFFRTITSIC